MKQYHDHYSVLKDECISYLTEPYREEACFLDFTFGGGGHSIALAEANEKFRVVSTDQDVEAFENGQKKLLQKGLESRVHLYKMNFSEFPEFLQQSDDEKLKSVKKFNGAMMDLGVSSHHFDSPERGFSFRFEGPLDMRMNIDTNSLTAEEVVNKYSEDDLASIFYEYGEERFSKRIAEKIIEERSTKTIKTTKDLENIIFHCYPKKMRFAGIHPATRCFQALRIFVNRELDVLSESIAPIFDLLAPGSRFAIISFHSLEDRIVKRKFLELKEEGIGKILTKKPVLPSKSELSANKRSRSAKLRVIEKL